MQRAFNRIVFGFAIVLITALSSAPAGAASDSEVQITDVVVGTGAVAELGATVKVHYTGWLMDGKQFDSSRTTDTPFEFSLGAREVIPGWDIGLQGMRVGGKRELVIPSELAYGKKGYPGAIPPNATLKFEVELLDTYAHRVDFIKNPELKKLLERGVPIIDIRRPAEWAETGIIEGSILITAFHEKQRFSKDFLRTLKATVGKRDEFIMIGKNGRRTAYLSGVLADRKGYTNIYNVQKGIDRWIAEGGAVVKAPQQ